jgi:osmotically-inducible protein OsmY
MASAVMDVTRVRAASAHHGLVDFVQEAPMKRSICAIAISFLAVSCSEPPAMLLKTQEPARPAANRLLAERVKRALEGEAKIRAAAIDVTAHGGIVTLRGTADSDDERIRAARVAYRVQGVNAVHNRLAIVRGS